MKSIKYSYCVVIFLLLGACTSKVVEPVPEQYKQPYRYLGQPISEVEKHLGVTADPSKKILIDMKDYHFMWESASGIVSYVEVTFKTENACSMKKPVPAESLLGRLDSKGYKLESVTARDGLSTFYDHVNKLKIGVACREEGFYVVYFSQKYYMR